MAVWLVRAGGHGEFQDKFLSEKRVYVTWDDLDVNLATFLDRDEHRVHYLRRPFQREPDFGVTSVNYDFSDLLSRAGEPS